MRWIVAGLLLVPLLEIVGIVWVGRAIGPWWTVGLLLALCALGAWLVRREGARTWRALREAANSGRMPAREMADAAVVLVGGILLLAPGFVTDAVGLFLVLPLTRPLTRRWLEAVVRGRVIGGVVPRGPGPWDGRAGGAGPGPPGPTGRSRSGRGEVIEGEIVDERPPEQGGRR